MVACGQWSYTATLEWLNTTTAAQLAFFRQNIYIEIVGEMGTAIMVAKNTKQKLLEQGLCVIEAQGFNNTGIQEVLSAVGVPKGSFYHYFKSKQDFGLQVLDYYAEMSARDMSVLLASQELPPLARLQKLFEHSMENCRAKSFAGGCLVGNLSNEMADVCPVFREKLASIWNSVIDQIATCLAAAQTAGEIDADLDVHTLANYLFNGWHGAMTRMKVTASAEPLQNFMDMTFTQLLSKSVPA